MSYFNIEKQIQLLKQKFNNCVDFAYRIYQKQDKKIGLIYLKSIIDQSLLSEAIYLPMQTVEQIEDFDNLKNIIKCADVKITQKENMVKDILDGKVIVLTDFSNQIIAVDILKFPTRTPSEPPTSPVIQGPREGFVEDLQTNITLLRRRIKSENLVLDVVKVGSETQTKVCITYLEGVANKKIIKKVKEKISQIKIDGILDSYYILSFLEDRPNSLFKQIGNSEKPDIVASKLLEGRVAIIVDNSPIVLTVPFVFIEDLQSSNDYYTNHHFSSFVRAIRLLGILIAVVAPGFYLALELFHYSILPLNFLITIADTTQGLPFTPFLEILFIFLLFQILYEVSLRLPSYLGLATSVVGALILGDTGVKAGLISPPGVIIVALAKIALYTIPEEASQITILQFLFIILGGSLGLTGLVAGIVYIINYLNVIDSFDTPYLAPYSPRIASDLKDGIFTEPVTKMKGLPKSFSPNKKERS